MAHSVDSDDESCYSDSGDERSLTSNEVSRDALFRSISKVHSSGSFATFGIIDNFANPGISVDPIGTVRLPLSEDDAHALIQLSCQAPFGKGTETLVDESIRKTWQIDAAKITFRNKGWDVCLERIVRNVAEKLGVTGGSSNVHAELYKMLLYEKGAMFKAHKDTEKTLGMFGTLIICLPSEHNGGAICLQHGGKTATFDTSKSSAFDATFAAWYADVTHEIERVQTGYRWVLVYNLIHNSKNPDLSASTLDTQIGDFAKTLRQWRRSGDNFFAYALEHQYTDVGLRLSQLKGDDYHRVCQVTQSCAQTHEFYVLLASIEMCITNMNCEEETESESKLRLTRIVNLEGFNLLVYSALSIPETKLLQEEFYCDRDPDTQCGGEYMGNQHAEIEQFFKDSAMIVIPKDNIMSLLLGKSASLSGFKRLIDELIRRLKQERDEAFSRELLVQICQSSLSAQYGSDEEKDRFLGPIAVAAVQMCDASLFTKIVQQTSRGFDTNSYSMLGELICLEDPIVSENDIVEVLTKNGKLHNIYNNLVSFYAGFCRKDSARGDQLQIGHVKRWLDTTMVPSLSELSKVYADDAVSIARIIVERGDDKFRQFVLYQAVRVFIDRFLKSEAFLSALLVELLLYIQASNSDQSLLESLLHRILESAISNFDLPQYATYIKDRYVRDFDLTGKIRGEKENIRVGPIKAIYIRAHTLDQDRPSRLLKKIHTQASKLTKEQLKEFLIPLLDELITIVDTSSPEAQTCYQSLIVLYITQVVGQEPKKPSNWARSEEVTRDCYAKCDHCLHLREFLKNPELRSYTLPRDKKAHCDWEFNYFKYFEVEEVDQTRVILTKTLKWWEERHQEWESRASDALETLRKLPQERLKQCLARQYDEIMNYRMVRVVDDDSPRPEHMNTARHRYETRSTVPQKRSERNS